MCVWNSWRLKHVPNWIWSLPVCGDAPTHRARRGKAESRMKRLQIRLTEAFSLWTLCLYELFLRVKGSVSLHWLTALLPFSHWDTRQLDTRTMGHDRFAILSCMWKRPRTLSLLSTVCHSNWITMNRKTRWRWLPGLQLTTGSTNVHLFYLCLRPKSTISDNLELHIHRHWLWTVEIVPTTQSAVWSTGHFLTPAHRLYSEIHICKYIHVVQLCESQGPGVIRHKKMTRR